VRRRTTWDSRAAAHRVSCAAAAAVLALGACTAARGPEYAETAGERAEIRLEGSTALPPGTSIHLAGSFNGWTPGDPSARLTELGGGRYSVDLPERLRGQRIEFKFTLGSWERVETDAAGADVPNRVFAVPAAGRVIYAGHIGGWRSPGSPAPPRLATRSASVSVLDEAFAMPQLNRTRRVWIYLPPGYDASAASYPVLYLQDGQNVFDAATSFAGEWGVDESLDSLRAAGDPGVIVVAVDHAGERRFHEYSPWGHPQHGGGEGDAYVDFLVETLKPHVDRRYRTRAGRESTGVAGSSMGGVISLYAALKHPEVFGVAGVFSPALWTVPRLYEVAAGFDPRRPRPRLYLVSGALEGSSPEQYVRDQARMIGTLEAAGWTVGRDLLGRVREDGTHTEAFWRREFPAAYRWLFPGD
jgi:predicted alpha/beta superfamily hydrolase